MNRESLQKQLLALSSFILTCAILEVALQVIDLPEDVHSGWKSACAESELNQLGYRGRRIEYSEDDFVVLLVGDSQAEATGVPFAQMPEVILESSLGSINGKKARVFTLAAGGTERTSSFWR